MSETAPKNHGETMIGQLFPLLFVFAAGAFYWHAQGVRSRATDAIGKHCVKLQVMLLDQTIKRDYVWPSRGPNGRLGLLWKFDYEVACRYDIHAGNRRYKGTIELFDQRIVRINFPTIDWPLADSELDPPQD
jgi:hypothetical protein